MEEAAENRLETEDVEVVAGGSVAPASGVRFSYAESNTLDLVGHQSAEGCVAVAVVEIVTIRLLGPSRFTVAVDDLKEGFRLRYIQRTEDEAVKHAEHDNVRADAQGERKDCGDAESRRLSQLADGEVHIREDALEAWPHPDLAAALVDSGYIAELAPGGLFGLRAAHAGGHERLHFFGEVLLDLFREVTENPVSREELP